MKFKFVKNLTIFFLLPGMILIYSGLFPAYGKTTDQLTGTTWVLTYDPDSPEAPPDDMMVFKKGNRIDLRDSKSVYLTCIYELMGNEVIVKCKVRGKVKKMVLTFSDDKSVLKNPSGAEYTRQ